MLRRIIDLLLFHMLSDASFAVGEQKQSISGVLVMINGTPILWGSLKQTAVVDATCSAEYVASSICCKQIIQAENMVQFLNFTCPKPYTILTESSTLYTVAGYIYEYEHSGLSIRLKILLGLFIGSLTLELIDPNSKMR